MLILTRLQWKCSQRIFFRGERVMRGIARRCLGERARKITFLLILIGLCSLCLGGSYTAWAAETHVAHPSSATFQHIIHPRKRPLPLPVPSAALINGQWICPPPYIAEVQNTAAPFLGPDGEIEPDGDADDPP